MYFISTNQKMFVNIKNIKKKKGKEGFAGLSKHAVYFSHKDVLHLLG